MYFAYRATSWDSGLSCCVVYMLSALHRPAFTTPGVVGQGG